MSAVLLLGGRSGIGLAVVEELLAGPAIGATVVLAQRPGRGLDDQRVRLLAAGAAAVEEAVFDATDLAGHEPLVRDVFARHEVSHAVVAFGLLGDQEQAWQDVAAAQRLMTVNATAAVGLGVALGSAMRSRGRGTIIALSSVAGTRVRRSNFVYGASKAAMDSFYTNLSVALQGGGVKVLVVRPGAVSTDMVAGREPVAFTVSPQQVGRAVVEALGRGREVVHVPAGFGPAMVAAQLVPRRLWRRIRH
ncbi:SDR family NAD(P)-dependent oxidoreductase [Luteococcus peritonei]|uniref:SDR family NAD(P)-dependent oxidoreductase n=1 Tax=Luteococcus peritonei TaxID=88874 RepID=A0ABW4RWA5_9ACTN